MVRTASTARGSVAPQRGGTVAEISGFRRFLLPPCWFLVAHSLVFTVRRRPSLNHQQKKESDKDRNKAATRIESR
jgi:hypothetical protein